MCMCVYQYMCEVLRDLFVPARICINVCMHFCYRCACVGVAYAVMQLCYHVALRHMAVTL